MPDNLRGNSYSLSTLLLVTALVAVCLGIMKVAPGTSLALAVIFLVAIVRTTGIVRGRRVESGPASIDEKVRIFATSLVISALAGVALIGTFLAVYYALVGVGTSFDFTAAGGRRTRPGAAIGTASGIVLGLIATRLAAEWIHVKVWSRQKKRAD